MMRSWSSELSSDQPEPIRKDHAMMTNLTPTNCKVNDLWIRENLAKAELHHSLTRAEVAPERRAAHTSRVSRLALVLTRPVRALAPQH
jgi:hypothetical protein